MKCVNLIYKTDNFEWTFVTFAQSIKVYDFKGF